VIEAVTEDAPAKTRPCRRWPAGTPLISNTSSIPIGKLARTVERPADLIGAHFMNPAYLMRRPGSSAPVPRPSKRSTS
jgi:methoxymalonate biosynthesis protein